MWSRIKALANMHLCAEGKTPEEKERFIRKQTEIINERYGISKPKGLAIENIAGKVPNPLEWWECDHRNLPEPSVAEQMIIDELNRYHIKWHREVSFAGLKLSDKGYPRYDIWCPDILLCIEYDGTVWHSTEQSKAIDAAKDRFCKQQGLNIVRYNKQHYYRMERTIEVLMEQYKIKKKNPGK